jgi:ketosteroid isomerase-like protein
VTTHILKKFVPGGFLVLLLCSCASQRPAKLPRQELLATDKAFSDMSQAQGVAAAFYFYLSTNALSLPAGEQPLRGREAIRDSLTGTPGVLRWQPRDAEAAASGDLGYTWGTFEYESKDAAGRQKISCGKYVTVWRKENGHWKAILDCGNSNPPPP